MASILHTILTVFQPSNQVNNVSLTDPQAAQTLAAPHPEHLGDPSIDPGPAAMQTIMQRFLQDFEYVKLDNPVSGSAQNPLTPMSRHPHMIFRMCADDHKAMDPDQVQVLLGDHKSRGIYLLRRLGLEVDDWYISKEEGELRFDAHVTNLPAGMDQNQALQQIADQLQQACTQARANAKQAKAVIGL